VGAKRKERAPGARDLRKEGAEIFVGPFSGKGKKGGKRAEVQILPPKENNLRSGKIEGHIKNNDTGEEERKDPIMKEKRKRT